MTEYIYGIDETAKCPVLGTLPVCIVKVDKHFFNRKLAKGLVIKDSKVMTPKQRVNTFTKLKKEVKFTVEKIYPKSMDGANLIDLEVLAIIRGLRKLRYKNGEKVYIDLFSSTSENLLERFLKFGFDVDYSKWVVEHGADDKYKPVSLASIFSKIYSEREHERLRRKYGEMGSGNPGDLRTIHFIIQNYDNLPWFVRKSWITVQRLKDPVFREKISKKVIYKLVKGKRTIKGLYDV